MGNFLFAKTSQCFRYDRQQKTDTEHDAQDTISFHQLIFCFPFLVVWPPVLLLFVFRCRCFLVPLDFFLFFSVLVAVNYFRTLQILMCSSGDKLWWGRAPVQLILILLPRKSLEKNGAHVYLSFFFIVFIQLYCLKTALGGFCYLGSPKPNFTLNSLRNFWSFLLQVCFHAFTILKRKVLYLESEDLHRKHT